MKVPRLPVSVKTQAPAPVSGWFGADRTRLQETIVVDDRKTDDHHKVAEAQRNQPEAELVAEAEGAGEDDGEDASEVAGQDTGEDDELKNLGRDAAAIIR